MVGLQVKSQHALHVSMVYACLVLGLSAAVWVTLRELVARTVGGDGLQEGTICYNELRVGGAELMSADITIGMSRVAEPEGLLLMVTGPVPIGPAASSEAARACLQLRARHKQTAAPIHWSVW
jgi:hypothetical protein